MIDECSDYQFDLKNTGGWLTAQTAFSIHLMFKYTIAELPL